jgi:hypothetical protein
MEEEEERFQGPLMQDGVRGEGGGRENTWMGTLARNELLPARDEWEKRCMNTICRPRFRFSIQLQWNRRNFVKASRIRKEMLLPPFLPEPFRLRFGHILSPSHTHRHTCFHFNSQPQWIRRRPTFPPFNIPSSRGPSSADC